MIQLENTFQELVKRLTFLIFFFLMDINLEKSEIYECMILRIYTDCILKESGESSMSDRAVRLFFFLACDDSNFMEEYLVAISSLDIDMEKIRKKWKKMDRKTLRHLRE